MSSGLGCVGTLTMALLFDVVVLYSLEAVVQPGFFFEGEEIVHSNIIYGFTMGRERNHGWGEGSQWGVGRLWRS